MISIWFFFYDFCLFIDILYDEAFFTHSSLIIFIVASLKVLLKITSSPSHSFCCLPFFPMYGSLAHFFANVIIFVKNWLFWKEIPLPLPTNNCCCCSLLLFCLLTWLVYFTETCFPQIVEPLMSLFRECSLEHVHSPWDGSGFSGALSDCLFFLISLVGWLPHLVATQPMLCAVPSHSVGDSTLQPHGL